jgi:nuclear pore complex protein Nup205
MIFLLFHIRSLLIVEFTGRLDIDGGFTLNEDFQQTALRVADELNLDELDAALICLESQTEFETSGRSLFICSIIRFHQRRKYLLDCLRLTLQLSSDVNQDPELREWLLELVAQVVRPQDALKDETRYVRRCLNSMSGDVKQWLQKLVEKQNSISVLGQGQQGEVEMVIGYQWVSLVKQHESLSIIVLYLVKQNYSSVADLDEVLATLRKADKFDHLLREYICLISNQFSHKLHSLFVECRCVS